MVINFILLISLLLFLRNYFQLMDHYYLILEFYHFLHQSLLNYLHQHLKVHITILLELQCVCLLINFKLYSINYFWDNILSDIYYVSNVMLEFFLELPITRQLFYQDYLINQDHDSTLLELVIFYFKATLQVFEYLIYIMNQILNYNQYQYENICNNILLIIYLKFFFRFQINYKYTTFQLPNPKKTSCH